MNAQRRRQEALIKNLFLAGYDLEEVYQVTRVPVMTAEQLRIEAAGLMTDDPCYCSAYPFRHERGDGDCRATGNTLCPNCFAVIDDRQLEWVEDRAGTLYDPPEFVPVLKAPCGRCKAEGRVV
jgi:hypothetical protein